MTEFLKIAPLDDDDVARVQALEEEMGVHIMAFTSGLDVAALSDEQVERIKALEDELGVTLLVYTA